MNHMSINARVLYPKAMFAFFTSVFIGCAAEAESPAYGSCKLKCNKPKVGSSQFLVEPLFANLNMTVACSASGAGNQNGKALGPVQVRFRVSESLGEEEASESETPDPAAGGLNKTSQGVTKEAPLSQEPGGAQSVSSQTTGGNSFFLSLPPLPSSIPRSNIGFEPVIRGPVSFEDTAAEFKVEGNKISPFRFAGVVTPSKEWCTDSCGVASYEFWPSCPGGSDSVVTAGIAVHGASIPEGYTVTASPSTQP